MRTVFHVLARGVVFVDGHVLLARTRGSSHTFLPGGHVQRGESIPGALERELRVELGAAPRVGASLGAVESDWKEGAIRHQEINHVFEVAMPGLTPDRPPRAFEAHLEFLWSPIDDLDRYDLRPSPLRDLLRRWVQGGGSSSRAAGEFPPEGKG